MAKGNESIQYGSNVVYSSQTGAWTDTNYRYVKFAKPTSEDLLTWLEANAVRLPLTGTWVFNATLSDPSFLSVTAYDVPIMATSNSFDMTAMRFEINTGTDKMEILYMQSNHSMDAYGSEESVLWTDAGYRVITFTKPVQYAGNEAFIKWFTANAIQLPAKGKSLNEYTWQEISAISAADKATEYGFKVGDTKTIHVEGTVGTLAVNNDYNVFILGINHNNEQSITFGTFKDSDGTNVCLCDSNYNGTSSTTTSFHMNTSQSNSGGWNKSAMRYYILGSTNVQNGNATTDCTVNPVKNSLMAALPRDLRDVLKPMTIYSDNTGGGSDTASYVTTTVDFLPLLAEYEVYGTRKYANSAEQNHQAQYQYYRNGKSKIKYKHNSTSTDADWYLRSVYSSSHYFCNVSRYGTIFYSNAMYCLGIAPIFRV